MQSSAAPALGKVAGECRVDSVQLWLRLKPRVIDAPSFGVEGERLAKMHLLIEEITRAVAAATMCMDRVVRIWLGACAIPFDDVMAEFRETAAQEIFEEPPLPATTDLLRLHAHR